MLTYLFKRLLAMIPTLLGITFVTFLIVDLAPGDPVGMAMGAGGQTRSAEGGSSDTSAGSEESRRTKQKLLGEIVEDFVARSWSADVTAALDVVRTDEDEREGVAYPELVRLGSGPELGRFATALAVAPDGRLVHGTDTGTLVVGTATSVSERLKLSETSITAVAVTPDGAIVTGDGNGGIRLVSAGTVTASSDAAQFPIADLAVLPDGTGVLAGAADGLIRRFSLPDLTVEATYEDHTGAVRSLALAADGSRFWSGGSDRRLLEWRLVSDRPVRELPRHGQSIREIVTLGPDRLATGCDDRLIRIVHLGEGATEPTILPGHYATVTALAYDADQDVLFSSGDDKTLRAWSLAQEREIARAPLENGKAAELVLGPDGTLWSASESWSTVPIHIRYWNWLVRFATLDFDVSLKDQRPVMDKIKEALPVTLYLNLIAILIIYGVSIPLGVMAAVKRGSHFDNWTSVILFLLWSIPNFWLATLLIMGFSSKVNLDVLPSVGLHSDGHEDLTYLSWLGDWSMHLVLPITVMTYNGFASLSRYMRTSMLETISQDYIRTARAKGLAERVVIFRHALRNSLITIITLVGNLLPAMIGGSVIVEYIFNINGMGRLGFDAILARDYPVIMAVTTFGALLTLVGILISDLLYGIADPRISHD